MPEEDSPVLFLRARPGLDRRALRQFARELLETVTKGRSFQCLVADDKELLRLNRQFLGKDYPTDVLSFPAAEGDPGQAEELGELAISSDRAFEQAGEFGHTPEDEIRILMLHGVLHLLGMDHEQDRGRMAREETKLRKRLGLPTGLIERVRA
jgi:probable rRNA maturation factor